MKFFYNISASLGSVEIFSGHKPISLSVSLPHVRIFLFQLNHQPLSADCPPPTSLWTLLSVSFLILQKSTPSSSSWPLCPMPSQLWKYLFRWTFSANHLSPQPCPSPPKVATKLLCFMLFIHLKEIHVFMLLVYSHLLFICLCPLPHYKITLMNASSSVPSTWAQSRPQ